jgi:RNA polymerase sigma-70 factor (ECF subfamily)
MESIIVERVSDARAEATTPTPTDEALLAAIARGDEAALEALYARYGRAVYTVALTVVRDHAEAEEVTQEAFLRTWLRARTYNPFRGRAATWLLRLARHLAIDQVRRRRLAIVALEPTDDAAWPADRTESADADVEQEVWLAEQRRLLLTALRALPAKQREVLAHAYYGGLSHAEIAARLGLPLGTVKSRTCVGLRRLRELVGRHDAELIAPGRGASRRWLGPGDAARLPAAS